MGVDAMALVARVVVVSADSADVGVSVMAVAADMVESVQVMVAVGGVAVALVIGVVVVSVAVVDDIGVAAVALVVRVVVV